MSLDLLALVDSAEPATMPALLAQDELLDLHQQLLTAAPGRGREFHRAAQIVRDLVEVLERFEGADPRTVSLVLTGLVAGLRRSPLRPGEDVHRFDDANGWLDHLRLQRRACCP